VKVHFTEVDEQIYVTISDNGPGIPAPARRTLLNPFVTAGKPNGTGLGLTLARQIAEEHGVAFASWNRIQGGPYSR
jgi:signal transduction histidine kinase